MVHLTSREVGASLLIMFCLFYGNLEIEICALQVEFRHALVSLSLSCAPLWPPKSRQTKECTSTQATVNVLLNFEIP